MTQPASQSAEWKDAKYFGHRAFRKRDASRRHRQSHLAAAP